MRLPALSGAFALLTGLLLRAAVGREDDTDWNGAVKVVLHGLPLILIIGGLLLLAASAFLVLRDAGRYAGEQRAAAERRSEGAPSRGGPAHQRGDEEQERG